MGGGGGGVPNARKLCTHKRDSALHAIETHALTFDDQNYIQISILQGWSLEKMVRTLS